MHTLLDLQPLAPESDTRSIVMSKQLAGTQSESLSDCPLAEPAATWQRPSKATLEVVWERFREAEDGRCDR